MTKQNSNSQCDCGSGKKFKKCCGRPKGVEPEVPLTAEEEAINKNRVAKAARFSALMAPFAAFGMPDFIASDQQRASEAFIKNKMK